MIDLTDQLSSDRLSYLASRLDALNGNVQIMTYAMEMRAIQEDLKKAVAMAAPVSGSK